jgi:hypothetical protein
MESVYHIVTIRVNETSWAHIWWLCSHYLEMGYDIGTGGMSHHLIMVLFSSGLILGLLSIEVCTDLGKGILGNLFFSFHVASAFSLRVSSSSRARSSSCTSPAAAAIIVTAARPGGGGGRGSGSLQKASADKLATHK